jgi:hypothetical protein
MLEGILITRVGFALILMLTFSVIANDFLDRENERLTLEAEGHSPEEIAAYADEEGYVPDHQEKGYAE